MCPSRQLNNGVRRSTKMNKEVYVGMMVAVLLLCASCQSTQTSTQEEQANGTDTLQDTLTYSYKTYVIHSDSIVETPDTKDTTFYKVSYPVFHDREFNDFVLNTLIGEEKKSILEAGENFISEFENFHLSDEYPRVWLYDGDIKVQDITPSYFCLRYTRYSYTGGAHGDYATRFIHFDVEKKETLTLTDFVDETEQIALTATAEHIFRQSEGLSADSDLDDYFFDDGKFSITDNFALEKDSLLLLYNIYEIKPYVDGETELRIPYDEIGHLFTEKGKHILSEIRK